MSLLIYNSFRLPCLVWIRGKWKGGREKGPRTPVAFVAFTLCSHFRMLCHSVMPSSQSAFSWRMPA